MGVKGATSKGRWGSLFPTTWSFIIFILYMVLFINQGILVTASQKSDNSYSYNTVTVVLLTEATKLLASFLIYLREVSLSTMWSEIKTHSKVLVLYMVPALLYCLYNNLAFVNLAAFDPTTYFLLLQLRVVVTGVVFQILFKKRLSGKQWLSLLILTMGCVVKQLHTQKKDAPSASDTSLAGSNAAWDLSNLMSLHTALILVQVLCSCLAGVYNEKLLKDTGAEAHIMLQNMFMYIDSIICNAAILMLEGNFFDAFSSQSLMQMWRPVVIVIILNNAGIGIVTSQFLKNLNSILKSFASALELMFTAVLSWLIFGIPINIWTALAILLVTYATWLYAQNPVVNRGRLDELEKPEETKSLINQETPTPV